MRITFNGAARVVTGSCHLVEAGGVRFLLDCGLFQGSEELEDLNPKFTFDPSEVDFVILSHGHLDHCGRLPYLVKKGFNGKIYATSGTVDIAHLILLDAAQVQEEHVKTANRKRLREGKKPKELLYTVDDVFDTFSHFTRCEFNRWYSVGPVKFRFHDAGHILCSEFIELEVEGKRLLFSGDVGNRGKPLIRDPEPPPKADVVLIETTYASRRHKSFEESVREFKEVVLSTFERGGSVLIPTFALERAQDILYILKNMYEKGELPPCRVFLDSPLAISVTKTFRKHPECLEDKVLRELKERGDIFSFPYLEFTRTVEESKRINDYRGRAIIIAGNGMCTGGRILHHIKHRIWDPRNSIVFVGYQAEGTLGRAIVEGAKKVKVFNEIVAVKASVYTINGFSSHADGPQLFEWLRRASKENTEVVLVHGEESSMEPFALEVKGKLQLPVYMPELYSTLEF
ncbi:MBL fold metallo-hydrolase RNA specificity domain-containing protein [Thermovibrio ammonificans]